MRCRGAPDLRWQIEIFRQLPVREEILHSLLAANLVYEMMSLAAVRKRG